jgi:hypothetical protein
MVHYRHNSTFSPSFAENQRDLTVQRYGGRFEDR